TASPGAPPPPPPLTSHQPPPPKATGAAEKTAGPVETGPKGRTPPAPRGLAAREVASRIARCYHDLADGASGFWIARARWAAADGRPTGRALYEVVRADGRVGVWDALTLDEGELIADTLTQLSL